MSAGEDIALFDPGSREILMGPRAWIIIPFGAGVVIGFFASGFFAACLWSLDMPIRPALIPGSAASLVAAIYTYRWLIHTNNDYNQAYIRKAAARLSPPQERVVQVERISEDGRTIHRSKLRASYTQRLQVAQKFLASKKKNLTYDMLNPIFDGDRAAISDYRQDLVDANWAEWGKNNELVITESGLVEFRRLVANPMSLPSPKEINDGRVGGGAAHARTHAMDGWQVYDD